MISIESIIVANPSIGLVTNLPIVRFRFSIPFVLYLAYNGHTQA